MKEDASTVPDESSAKAKPGFEAAKSRVTSFITSFIYKKKTTPEKLPATQDGPVRQAIGSIPAALFLDAKGKIVTAHPRCAGFFGRQPDELSGLNIKDLVLIRFEQQITNILAKGKEANELPFHVLALRKDGSEFATQFSFRFLQDFRFRWAVFVQGPAGSVGGADQSATEPQAIVPTTETTTTETPEPASTEKYPVLPVGNEEIKDPGAMPQHLEAENRNLIEFNAKARAELDKERETIKVSRKKEEVFQTQVQQLQGALEQAEARAHERAPQSRDWEKKAANLKKCVDELTRRHAAEQNAAVKAAQRVKELEEQLKRAGDNHAPGKKAVEDQNDTRHRLKAENRNLTEANAKARAELDREREAVKVSRKKEEELQTQVQKLQGALEQAKSRAHENAPESKDWEKKAAGLKKSVDDLTRRHAAEQNAAVKAAQRVRELEEQLKRSGGDRAAGKKATEDQNDTRHRLKAENRDLTEANAKAKAELDKEREAIKISRKKEEELETQVEKLQGALEQAEARAHESAPQSEDWEKKAAELEKSVDELTRRHEAEQNAAVKAAERVKELEEQLKRAGHDQAAGKKDIEDQDATRQRLEAEIRNLTEANDRTKTDLEKERKANKLSRKKEEELDAQVQKLQRTLEQAEARARESSTQSRDWEKKAADLNKSVDELTRSRTEQSAAAKRVRELEEQLKRASDDLAASKAENRNLAESAESQAALEKKTDELEKRALQIVSSLAKTNAELESQRVGRERAEKSASSAAAQIEKLEEKLKRQAELERTSQSKIAKLEKTIQDRGDDLARASAALRKEVKERQASSEDAKKAADLKKSVDELTRKHAAEQNTAVKAAQRVKELEEQLKRAGDIRAAGNKDIEGQVATLQRLEAENRSLVEANAKARAELDKERDTIKVSQKKEEELQTEVQKLQSTIEQAEARARESAAQSRDWEKKTGDLKKSVDELTRKHAAEQNAAVKAAQHVKELEQQLKRAEDDRAAGKKNIEDQDATRQRLEAENRNLIEAHAKAKAELDKERQATKVFRKREEELDARVQKLQGALEQAEARARESVAESKDRNRKAADFKKSLDELTRNNATEQSAAAKRITELEQQLKRASNDLAASKAENRNLSESAESQAALEKKADELEQRARQSVSSLAKANAELESQRVERERAEKSASSAAAQIEKLEEKLKRQVELERASQSKIAELEKTMHDRVSEMGNRLESKLAERLQMVERSLAEANSGLEKEAERRRDEGLLADAREQLENLSVEIFTKARRTYGKGHYSDCHELMKELMGIVNEKISIFNDAWDLHIQTLMKLGRFDEAKTVVQQRIKSVEDRLGKKHPYLICPLTSLAAILERTGYMFEAEQAMRRVSSIEKSSSLDA